jgi:hypothetical protein
VDLALTGIAYVEANWGRWVARCPRPLCTNALAVEPGQLLFVCTGLGGCGIDAPVVWPADPQAIEMILEMRPVSRTRNWVPGETLEDLLAENAAHGCLPPALLELAAATAGTGEKPILLATIDNRVVGGVLHHQLVAAGRREIGA